MAIEALIDPNMLVRKPRIRTYSTESVMRLGRRTLARGAYAWPAVDTGDRPRTWGECIDRGLGDLRPCPYLSCRHHVALVIHERTGAITIAAPHITGPECEDGVPEIDLAALPDTCSLVIAARGAQTLEAVGSVLFLTRERVRQIEAAAFDRARGVPGAMDVIDEDVPDPWHWRGASHD